MKGNRRFNRLANSARLLKNVFNFVQRGYFAVHLWLVLLNSNVPQCNFLPFFFKVYGFITLSFDESVFSTIQFPIFTFKMATNFEILEVSAIWCSILVLILSVDSTTIEDQHGVSELKAASIKINLIANRL